MGSWFAGRVALPRPLETLKETGTLGAGGVMGVMVKQERIVRRWGGEEVEMGASEERGGTTGDGEIGELKLEEEEEDLVVPVA